MLEFMFKFLLFVFVYSIGFYRGEKFAKRSEGETK